MSLHRLTQADFAETQGHTQPIVHPARGTSHPEAFSGIPDRWGDDREHADLVAEDQYREDHGSVLLLVVEALCWTAALGLIVALFKAPELWGKL